MVVNGLRHTTRAGAIVALFAAWLVLLGPAVPASAHTVSGVGATNFRTTLSALTPPVPGVSLRVIENGSRLELRNESATDVVVAGYSGEPYARIGPAGVFVNDNSPATYLNVDRYQNTPVPAGVDAKAPPAWRQVATEPVWRWHDHRVHWMLKSLPPPVAADPGSPHRISNWTVVLEQGRQRLTATGSLDWVPGPSPTPWFALAAVIAAGIAALVYLGRPHRLLALATGALIATDVTHRLGVMFVINDTVPAKLGALFGGDALLVWPFAVFGALLLWRRHTRATWLSAVAAALTVFQLTIDDVPVLWRSSAPTVFPSTVERAVVTVVLGIGAGLVLAVALLLAKHRTPSRPWRLSEAESEAESEAGAESNPAASPAPAPASTSSGVTAKPSAGTPTAARPNYPTEPNSPPDSPEPARRDHPQPGDSERGDPQAGDPQAGDPRPGDLQPGDSERGDPKPGAETVGVGRRQVTGLLAAGALGALVGAGAGSAVASSRGNGPGPTPVPPGTPLTDVGARTVAFHGPRQAGIATPVRQQAQVWVAGFDLAPGLPVDALRALLRGWTDAAAKLTAGEPLGHPDDAVVAGLGPAALSVTVGFGPSLFGQAGIPATARPAALTPLPAFTGEALDPAHSNGDLGVVVAGDDPVVVSHAAKVLRRVAGSSATLRWQMSGFNSARGSGPDTMTFRNLMGQVDGSNNPQPTDPDFDARVFVAAAADPVWLRGGSYLVFRRIRMLLDDWDALSVTDQEHVIGRRKDTGAPLSGGAEHTPSNFGARTSSGALAIPETAHIRLATPAFNQGAAMLRRGFSYVDGDESGLLFLAWQADPRHGFVPVQQRLVGVDALSRFIRHETSALFAMPGGISPGGYLGQSLLESM
jgi:deferrochelatase/peroxidase EfeB